MTRDHGGNLDEAIAHWGGDPADWIDLSTGINRVPYPLPDIPQTAWQALPTKAQIAQTADAARRAYGTDWACLPLAGAQAAIQIVPRLTDAGLARVLGPTYNEHAAALTTTGWQVEEVTEVSAMTGADLAVVVNPNNPTGRQIQGPALLSLAKTCGHLVVDESFCDVTPDLSLLHADPAPDNVLVLRSFGKFFGHAGLRLGFALGPRDLIARMADLAGPWPVSGPALHIGRIALQDTAWQADTRARLAQDAARADDLAAKAGWTCVGGTALFRLYDTGSATTARDHLARQHIWTRAFPWSSGWLRLGLPGAAAEWTRLEAALRSLPDRPAAPCA